MNEAPVRLCCGQRHYGAVCPDGKVMCQLCYERVEQDKLHELGDGSKEDICIPCSEYERKMMGR